MGPDTRCILEVIELICDSILTYEQKPRVFTFALHGDEDFNHSIYADIFYIVVKKILHMVEESTNFQ